MTHIDMPDGDRVILHGLNAPEGERGAIERLGQSRWIARPPKGEGQDVFVALRMEDGVLLADSFQGLRFRIDLTTGAVTADAFVK